MNGFVRQVNNITAEVVVDFDLTNVNKFRKLLLTGIPSAAIDEINIYKPYEPHYQEIIFRRLELIPFTFHDFPINQIGEYLKETYILKTFDNIITSKDIQISNEYEVRPLSNVYIIFGQELNVEMKVKIGIGAINTKYSPVTVVQLKEIDNKYKITIETNEGINPVDVLNKGLTMMREGHDIHSLIKQFQKNKSD